MGERLVGMAEMRGGVRLSLRFVGSTVVLF